MSINNLKKNYKEILGHEKRAKHFYEHYIDQIDNEEIKKELIVIRNDEEAHIKLARRLIELAEQV